MTDPEVPEKPDDEWLQQQAATLVERMMANAAQHGHDPENVWLMLALAAEGAERALLYACGAMDGALAAQAMRDYATAKLRLQAMRERAEEAHQGVREETDAALGIKRGKPS